MSRPGIHSSIATTALMTPVSGRVYDGNTSISSSNARAMGDPGRGVDPAFFDQPDDAREVGRQGVARAEQRALGLVEDRVAEVDLVGGDADEDQPAGVRDVGRRRSTSTPLLPGGVDDHVGQVAVGQVAQILLELVRRA